MLKPNHTKSRPPATAAPTGSLGAIVAQIQFAMCAMLLAVMIGLFGEVVAHADQPAAVTMTASPGIILADGRSTTTIAAIATGLGGRAVVDGTLITFATTAGTLTATSASTTGGIARVTLTSAPLPQHAIVTARYLAGGVGANNQITVEFTNDSAVANTDQVTEEWAQLSSADYLGYGADSRTVDAFAKKQGVRFTYRGTIIDADALQVDLSSNVVRARGATIYHNRQTVTTADSLCYEFINHSGTAVINNPAAGGGLEAVRIIGVDLKVEPLDRAHMPPSSNYQFADISSDRVTVTASSLSVKPNDKIQFRRATVFVDGKKIIALPIHIMPINTDQVFGQQVLGYGTDGVYLNAPYYVGAGTHTTDTLFLRSLSASRENGTFTTTPSAFSLDYQHDYKLASGDGDGSFQLLGLQKQGSVGLRWRHNHLIGRDTRTYLYVDRPNPRSIFSTANISQQFKGFSANLSNSISTSNSVGNSSSQQRMMSAYVETSQRKLIGDDKTGLRMVADVSTNTGTQTVSFMGTSVTNRTDSKSADLRFFTPSIVLNKASSLSDSFNVGGSRDGYTGESALTMHATLGLQTRVAATSSISFNYGFAHDPLNRSFRIVNNAISLRSIPNLHTLGVMFFTSAPNAAWDLSLMSNIAVPTSDLNTIAALNYRVGSQWRMGLTNTLGRTNGLFYKDFGLSLGRKIGPRELDISWSAIDHRVRANLDSARF